jgi:hypothetical protein
MTTCSLRVTYRGDRLSCDSTMLHETCYMSYHLPYTTNGIIHTTAYVRGHERQNEAGVSARALATTYYAIIFTNY